MNQIKVTYLDPYGGGLKSKIIPFIGWQYIMNDFGAYSINPGNVIKMELVAEELQ